MKGKIFGMLFLFILVASFRAPNDDSPHGGTGGSEGQIKKFGLQYLHANFR